MTSSRVIAAKLSALQQRMDENKSPAKDLRDLAGDVKDLLNTAAEDPMKAAAAQISAAAQQKADPKASADQQKQANAQRNEQMNNAAGNQQRAGEQLQSALDKLGSVGSLSVFTVEVFMALACVRVRARGIGDCPGLPLTPAPPGRGLVRETPVAASGCGGR